MRLRLPGRPGHPHGTEDDAAGGSTPAPQTGREDRDPITAGTAAPAPTPERGPRLRAAMRALAIASAQLLLIVGALVVLGWVIGRLWVVLLPVVLGLLITTVLWPLTRFLRAHRWPPALAAIVVVLLFLGGFGGIIAVIAPPVVDQVGELVDQTTIGLQQLQDWLTGPPFNLGEDQIGNAIDQAINSLQANAQNIANYALTGATAIGSGVVTLVLALVLTFFFLKDGPRWLPWVAAQTGRGAAPHIAALSEKTWRTLSEFIRQQALVGFVDAFFIGLGLWILGVPLVLPLAVITFFGAFIPIIGAFVAGFFAVIIALVSNGFTTALIVLGIVVLVQQIEGNVLQPILQGRGLNLHPAVVILAVTAGSSLYGIIGAFLAVPVAALIAVAYRYARDVLDGRSPAVAPDGTFRQVAGDETGAHMTRERGDAPPGEEAPVDRLSAGPEPQGDRAAR